MFVQDDVVVPWLRLWNKIVAEKIIIRKLEKYLENYILNN